MSLDTMKREEASILHRLPQHAQSLATAFFKSKRLSLGTRLIYMKALLSFHGVIPTPLVETCNQNLSLWCTSVNANLKPYTVYLYGIKLRTLYTFHLEELDKEEEEAQQISKKLFKTIPFHDLKKEGEKQNQLRDKLVTTEEFQRLVNATDHPRVRALLAVALDSGVRPTELCGTRIRDFEFADLYGVLRVSGKTGERTICLIKCLPYLQAWLQVHPDKYNPNAPLFAVVYKGKITFPNRSTITVMVRTLCKRAGIDRRLYPYMFRHTRCTDLASRGIGEFNLKSFAGWTTESKMASRYVHLSGRDSIKAILQIEGIPIPSQEKSQDYIKTKTCPRCNAENEQDALYCRQCSLVLDEKVLFVEKQELKHTDALMDQLIQHPTVQRAIKDAVKEMLAQGSWKP
jgi:integrase/ribosomal protein L40E